MTDLTHKSYADTTIKQYETFYKAVKSLIDAEYDRPNKSPVSRHWKRKNTKKLMGDNLEKLLDVHFAMLKTEAGRRDVLECKAKTARRALEAAQSKLDEMNQFKIDS